jgi:hypothetical protein
LILSDRVSTLPTLVGPEFEGTAGFTSPILRSVTRKDSCDFADRTTGQFDADNVRDPTGIDGGRFSDDLRDSLRLDIHPIADSREVEMSTGNGL